MGAAARLSDMSGELSEKQKVFKYITIGLFLNKDGHYSIVRTRDHEGHHSIVRTGVSSV